MIREPFVAYGSVQGFNTWLDRCKGWAEVSQVDALTEYAGRVCYKSDDKMFKSHNYIKARMDEGHEDIAEHPWISMELDSGLMVDFIRERPKHMNLVRDRKVGTIHLGATARTWRQLLRNENYPITDVNVRAIAHIKAILFAQGPKLFGEYESQISSEVVCRNRYHDNFGERTATTESGAKVDMLYRSMSLEDKQDGLSSATFEINHITRAATHQLVRHRGLSFSQESQRYTDLSKSSQGYAGPLLDYLDEDTADSVDEMLESHWWAISDMYEKMRDMGVRKEDARCVLPNMAGSRIVVSGSLE